jgi:hypothetical protein
MYPRCLHKRSSLELKIRPGFRPARRTLSAAPFKAERIMNLQCSHFNGSYNSDSKNSKRVFKSFRCSIDLSFFYWKCLRDLSTVSCTAGTWSRTCWPGLDSLPALPVSWTPASWVWSSRGRIEDDTSWGICSEFDLSVKRTAVSVRLFMDTVNV